MIIIIRITVQKQYQEPQRYHLDVNKTHSYTLLLKVTKNGTFLCIFLLCSEADRTRFSVWQVRNSRQTPPGSPRMSTAFLADDRHLETSGARQVFPCNCPPKTYTSDMPAIRSNNSRRVETCPNELPSGGVVTTRSSLFSRTCCLLGRGAWDSCERHRTSTISTVQLSFFLATKRACSSVEHV